MTKHIDDTIADEGFSLLEVLVAFLIVSLALVGMSKTLQMVTRSQSLVADRNKAVSVAQRILDDPNVLEQTGDNVMPKTGSDEPYWQLHRTVLLENKERAVRILQLDLDVFSGRTHQVIGHYRTFLPEAMK
ncbi:type IV pilus modification PilV family protein [Allorhizobium undicola]|uniref:type IV pilus modification PilV family protein n=1 Tax=Allorhizobium undicola TaxID=78527 RepID=UPI000485B823|nr:prepilin-type N-terminal cleavage/methylation domain-containing protein [Allorhizobium undicola]